MFLQTVSRPDISFSLNIASRGLEKPSQMHWMLVKPIKRYLKGTIDLGLLYCRDVDFVTYCDAGYAGDKETRKSISAVVHGEKWVVNLNIWNVNHIIFEF